MRSLVQGGDVDKAADMAITILSVVDDNDKLKKDETVRCVKELVTIAMFFMDTKGM